MFKIQILSKRQVQRYVNGQNVDAIEFRLQHDAGDPANVGTYPGVFALFVAPGDARAAWDVGDVIECTLAPKTPRRSRVLGG